MARTFVPLITPVAKAAWDPRLVVSPVLGAEYGEEDKARQEMLAAARAAEAKRSAEHAAAMASLKGQIAALEATEGRMAAVVQKVEEERSQLLRDARAGLAELILVAAKRIAGDALHTEPALLDALVDEGVSALGEQGLTLRVSLVDYDRVQERLGFQSILVLPDPSIDGGCSCEGPAGRIDATTATAAAAVAAVLVRWAER